MYSMTGYGKGEAIGEHYQLTAEIKSVNHRFRDCRFKMGQIFFSQEIGLRKKIDASFKRGSFDIYINYKRAADQSRFDELDDKKIVDFLTKMKKYSEQADVPYGFRGSEFLRSEFQMEKDDKVEEELVGLLGKAVDDAIVALKDARLQEGEALKIIIKKHLSEYEEFFQTVVKHAETYRETIRNRILEKFKEFNEQMASDDPRFLQEVIFYLEKVDIHEEINRIETHLKKLNGLFDQKNEKGRQIDFILQELGRETNTIGSKSSIPEISESVVQMKVRLEKIREQALNLE